MPTPSQPLSAEFLAEHQHFVRRLATSLERDQASADDLAQETWLSALLRGPVQVAEPRAWLATLLRRRALNRARDASVRAGHERRAARDEAAVDERLRERVSFQQSVVAEVLALDEPYRSLILLRYFEDLSPAAIARRRKLPAATVRSQLVRARARLRVRLEQRPGGREAWTRALAGFLARAPIVPSPALAVLAGAALVAGGGALAWSLAGDAAKSPLPAVALAPEPAPRAQGADGQPGAAGGSARTPVVASAAPKAASPVVEGPGAEEIAALTLDQASDMLLRVEDELRGRLLVPDGAACAAYAAAHPGVATGFARLLDRSRFDLGFDSGPVGIRGGGAYFSFVTKSNSYDQQPTLGLDSGRFLASFYGGASSVVLDLGEADLADPYATSDASWGLLLAALAKGPALPLERADPSLRGLLEGRARMSAPLALGHAYVVRAVSQGEHDVLAAFVPLSADEYGITIAWRVLSTWPVADPRGPIGAPERKTLAPQPWTRELTTPGLIGLLGRLRARTTELLMAVPPAVRELAGARPVARLLRDYHAGRRVAVDGSGRYFDFAKAESTYQGDPDIALQNERLSLAGDGGLLIDLGVASIGSVDAAFVPVPTEATQHGWELAWTWERRVPAAERAATRLTHEETAPFRTSVLARSPRAQVGHCYLVRSVNPGAHDHLVAFEVLAEDEHGIFVTWRILKTWPA